MAETKKTHSSMDEFELAGHALEHAPVKGVSGKAGPHVKPTRHMHIQELHDGNYHMDMHHPEGTIPETGSGDLDDVHNALEKHFGKGGGVEKEGAKDKNAGENAGGDAKTAQSKPDGGQGETESHEEK